MIFLLHQYPTLKPIPYQNTKPFIGGESVLLGSIIDVY